LEKGFAKISRSWRTGDIVQLELGMPVRRVVADEKVKADQNRFAVERGPLVYCAEGVDNDGAVLDKVIAGQVRFASQWNPDLLGGVVRIQMSGAESSLECIPYYAWCHRGANEMRVWFPTQAEEKLASHCWEHDSVEACFDGKNPANSHDTNLPRFTWWDHRGTAEWVQCPFEKPTAVHSASVYWYDDTGSGACRVPASWRLLYLDGKEWKPVETSGEYGVALDKFNTVEFKPVTTQALRLEVQLQPNFSGGILEWKTS
jgi:hypothetical protein